MSAGGTTHFILRNSKIYNIVFHLFNDRSFHPELLTLSFITIILVDNIFPLLSGQFKGYGFACFNSKVAALQARHVLEGQEVDGHVVDVSWLKEGVHQLTDLQSKVQTISAVKSKGYLSKLQSFPLNTSYQT